MWLLASSAINGPAEVRWRGDGGKRDGLRWNNGYTDLCVTEKEVLQRFFRFFLAYGLFFLVEGFLEYRRKNRGLQPTLCEILEGRGGGTIQSTEMGPELQRNKNRHEHRS